MKLLIATRNHHKFQEISRILHSPHLSFFSLHDWASTPDVIEDGATYELNAIKKAVTLARFSGLWTLADDSGLDVDALGGEPGVYSARYAGEPTNDAANNRKLLNQLAAQANRQARFRCVIALSDPSGQARSVSGVCEGSLLTAARGQGGFGYDSLFVPSGYNRTFAELSAKIKNTISHRAKALSLAANQWSCVFEHETTGWPGRDY